MNVGSRTWLGNISEKVLFDLKLELTKASSKNAAIACYTVKTRKRIEILWHVGSIKRYEEGGSFCNKTSHI